MKHLRWICAGALVGLAGTIALTNVAAPSRPTAAAPAAPETAPIVAASPATPVATSPVAAAPAKPAPAVVPGTAGMLIAIDPETGEVGMPSPEQIAAMGLTAEEAVSREIELTVVHHPNGMQSMDHEGRFQEYAVVRKTADGKVVTGCVDDPSHINHVHPAPAAGLEEK